MSVSRESIASWRRIGSDNFSSFSNPFHDLNRHLDVGRQHLCRCNRLLHLSWPKGGSACLFPIQTSQFSSTGDWQVIPNSTSSAKHPILSRLSALAFAFPVMVFGCQHSSTTGGDSPITRERLSGTKLVDIRQSLSWTFVGENVVIENGGQPIPPDIVKELLGNESSPIRIEATWDLDEDAKVLRLTEITSGGIKSEKEVTSWISPAGHVRCNLGLRQYNLFRNPENRP